MIEARHFLGFWGGGDIGVIFGSAGLVLNHEEVRQGPDRRQVR